MPRLEAAEALEAVESGRMGLNVKRGCEAALACPIAEPEAVVIANSEGGTGAWGNGGVVEPETRSLVATRLPVASETVALLWHFFDVMCDE